MKKRYMTALNRTTKKHKSEKQLPGHYIFYRSKPKKFTDEISQAIVAKKQKNPLYSPESLKKYFETPTSSGASTLRYMASKQQQQMVQSDDMQKFKSLVQKMRDFQRVGSRNLKKKFELIEQFNKKYQKHFGGIQRSIMHEEINDSPATNLQIERNLQDRQRSLRKNKFKLKMEKYINKHEVYAKTTREYLEKDEQWKRYGYTLEIEDDEKLIQASLERRNQFLRAKSKRHERKYLSPELRKDTIDKDIITYSRFYMQKRAKTVS